MKRLRVVFAGTPAFAVPSLQLLHSCHDLLAVWTRPDRPAGRGRAIRESAIKQAAMALGVPVQQPATAQDLPALMHEQPVPDVLVVVAFGMLLPVAVLAWPLLGALNVHASLLPRWRGAAPVARAIEAGDTETGTSIMRMEAGLDTGPVYLQHRLALGPEDSAGRVQELLAEQGARTLLKVLEQLPQGIEPTCQPVVGVSYAHKLQKQEAWLSWPENATALERKVRALNPYPIAQTLWKERVLRVHRSQPVPGPAGDAPGTILRIDDAGLEVATGTTPLRLLEVQPQGGCRMSAAAFAHGQRLRAGDRLGGP